MWSLSQKYCLIVVATAVWTDHALAQYVVRPHNECGSCQQQGPYSGATPGPFVQTQYQPQPTVRYQGVAAASYHPAAVSQTVPATAYGPTAVDRRRNQPVGTPHHVTQQIPTSVNRQHPRYGAAPYQTNPRIPSVTTPLWPNQSVQQQLPQPQQAATVGPILNATAPAPLTPADPFATSTWATLPATPSIAASPQVSGTPGPIPDPKFLDTPSLNTYGSWTTIPRQRSPRDQLAAGGSNGNGTTGGPVKLLRPTAADRFVRAPSAAIVWQTPRAIRRP